MSPSGFKNRKAENFKKISKLLVECFSFLNKWMEVESAKPLSSYLDGLQRGFIIFYNSDIEIRNVDVFIDHGTVLFHVLDSICKDKPAAGKLFASHNVLTKQNILTFY